MAKVWRVILTVSIVLLILGAVFVLVGRITGGDSDYVWNLFSSRPDVKNILDMGFDGILDSVLDKLPLDLIGLRN